MERIAHLGPDRYDTDLEVFRLDDGGIEIVLNAQRRIKLEPGDRIAAHGKWDLWDGAAGCETSVTLVRANGESIAITYFEFDMVSGGWLPNQIQEELAKVCEVALTEEKHDHRKG